MSGLAVWTEDEGGPYQAIPHAGPSWQPEGEPARQPHEYIRGGTVKLLTLLRPATGEVRAEPVERAPNAVLHPWLKQELTAILQECPPAPDPVPVGRRWIDWDYHREAAADDQRYPPLRLLLIWDNLKGHLTPEMVEWCHARGIGLLYTPLSGSWLNMAESVQRIMERRALEGQHPEQATTMLEWFRATVVNTDLKFPKITDPNFPKLATHSLIDRLDNAPASLLFESVTLASSDVDGRRMVQEAVENGRGDRDLGEEARPVAIRLIRREHDRSFLVPPSH